MEVDDGQRRRRWMQKFLHLDENCIWILGKLGDGEDDEDKDEDET